MAESTAIIGYGGKFYYSTTAITGPFTQLTEIISAPPPSPSVDEAEVTHMESPNSYREFIPTLIDPGELEIEFNYTKTAHQWCNDNLATSRWFRVELSDGATFDFKGYVMEVSNETPVDDRISFTASIRVQGAITRNYP